MFGSCLLSWETSRVSRSLVEDRSHIVAGQHFAASMRSEKGLRCGCQEPLQLIVLAGLHVVTVFLVGISAAVNVVGVCLEG